MKRVKRIVIIAISFAVLIALAPLQQFSASKVFAADDTVEVSVRGTYGQTEARSMFQMVNDFRNNEGTTDPDQAWWLDPNGSGQRIGLTGLGNLVYDYRLEEIAMQRAAEQAVRYGHTRPDGTSCLEIAGVNAENIARGQGSATAAFNTWLEANETTFDEQGHRANMLGGYYVFKDGTVYKQFLKTIGIGHYVKNGVHYWVQVFGTSPMSTTPTPANDSDATVSVNVKSSLISRYNINVGSAIEVGIGEDLDLNTLDVTTTATISSGSFPVESDYTWTSGNTQKATVTNNVLHGKSAGTVALTVTNTQGTTKTVNATIRPTSIKNANVTVTDNEFAVNDTLDANAIGPKVTFKGKELQLGTDYKMVLYSKAPGSSATDSLTYPDDNGETMTVEGIDYDYWIGIEGIGDYEGTADETVSLELSPGSIAAASVDAASTSFTVFDEVKAEDIDPEVTLKGKTLEYGKDYEVILFRRDARTDEISSVIFPNDDGDSMTVRSKADEYWMEIAGIGNYTDRATAKVTLDIGLYVPQLKTDESMEVSIEQNGENKILTVYTDVENAAPVTVTSGNTAIVNPANTTVEGSSGGGTVYEVELTPVRGGTTTVHIQMGEKENIHASSNVLSFTVTVGPVNFADHVTAKLEDPEAVYRYSPDTEHTPKVLAYYHLNDLLVEGTDYTLSYEDNVFAGEGKIIVSPVDTDNYEGSVTVKFTISPAETAIKDDKEITAANELTYGQKTSEATVDNAVFVAKGTSTVLDGEFALGEPDKVLPAGNQLVSWTFTPSNSNYEPLTGEVIIPVKKAVPEVESLPTVAEAPYHPQTKLENRALSGGEVSVPGTWSWDDPDIIPEAGSDEFTAVFTPEDQDNYEQVTAQVEVTTLKASPVVTDLSATEITYGDTLEKSELSGSAAYSNTDSTSVAGSFAWKDSSEKPSVADSESTEYDVVFTPADNRNYESIESKVKIKVNKADRPAGAPSGVINVGFGTETVDQSILSDYPDWEFDGSDIGTPLDAGETATFTVTYTGADAGNYNNLTAEVSVFRSTCDHKDLTKFEGSPNNCLQPGIREHWQCNSCGKYFADSEARNEIEENSWIIPPQHTLEFVEAHEYCDQTGNIAHWHCVVCNRLFLDENAEEFRQYDDIYSVEPIGHDWGEWKVVKESEYPCAGAGQEVRICKRNSEHVQYRDIELLAHEIEHVDGVDPTCTEDGNIEYWYCSVCGQLFSDESGTTTISEDETVIPTPGHQWDEGRITTEATTSKPGEKVFTCTVCGETMTETIPQLPDPKKEVGEDGTAVGPGASIIAAEAAITGMKSDKDPAGTVFGLVQLKSTKQTKTSVTLKWKKVAGATKYYVYGNMCGSANRMVRQTIVNGTSLKVTKVIGNNKKAAKVKKGKYYKFVVLAVNSQGRVVSTSKVVHVATKGGKIGNHKKVTTKAKKNKVTIKKGKKFKLAGKAIPGKLKVKNHRKVAYESSNKAIATVNSKGQIKGVKKGKCYIYAYAQNGIFAKIKVTVK